MRGPVAEESEAKPISTRVALVTGASRGIGAAIARALAARGCHVVITARSASDLEAVASEIRRCGGTASVIPADIVNREETMGLVRSILGAQGRIDILVSCAGVLNEAALLDLTDEALANAFETNLLAPARLTREVARAMVSQRSGRIIYIGSMFADVTARGYMAYTSSKAGLAGLAKTLAVELAPLGIPVNTVAPGHVRTDMIRELLDLPDGEARIARNTPSKRIAEPEEVASVVAFLALDAPSFLTGEVTRVDGGYTCR
jgi:NAD(P)-dependent dehydrogenase (short-subunit alcohol dehydrogenase family)